MILKGVPFRRSTFFISVYLLMLKMKLFIDILNESC